jgi:PDDEXK-like uncharacterized protein DUF3799
MFQLRDYDGKVHFSLARLMADSPAKARHACENPTEPTSSMLFGSMVDHVIMPAERRIVVFPGAIRRGKEWDAFKAANEGALIVKIDEMREAEACAQAVLNDPDVREFGLFNGDHQHPFAWEMHGLPWATRGLDVLGANFVNDLKTTSSTEPSALSHHIRKMKYPEQLATYRRAARLHGKTIERCYLTCVESRPPWDVVVVEFEPEELDEADQEVELWCARIRRAEESQDWGKRTRGVMKLKPKSAWEMAGEAEDT